MTTTINRLSITNNINKNANEEQKRLLLPKLCDVQIGQIIGELIHGGETEGLQGDAVAVRAVPGEAQGHLSLAGVSGREGRAGGDAQGAAHDGIGAEMPHAEIRDVHSAASAAAASAAAWATWAQADKA